MSIASKIVNSYADDPNHYDELLWDMQDNGGVQILTHSDDEGDYTMLQYKFFDGSSCYWNDSTEEWYSSFAVASSASR